MREGKDLSSTAAEGEARAPLPAVEPLVAVRPAGTTAIVGLDREPKLRASRAFGLDVGKRYYSELEALHFPMAGQVRDIERPSQVWGIVRPTVTDSRASPGYLVYWDRHGLIIDTQDYPQIDTGHAVALSLGGSDTKAVVRKLRAEVDTASPPPRYPNFFPQARAANEHREWRRFEDQLYKDALDAAREDPPHMIYYGVRPRYPDPPRDLMETVTPLSIDTYVQKIPYHRVIIEMMEAHPHRFTPEAIQARQAAGEDFIPDDLRAGLTSELAPIPAQLAVSSFENRPSLEDLQGVVSDIAGRHFADIAQATKEAELSELAQLMRNGPAEGQSIAAWQARMLAIRTAHDIPAEAAWVRDRMNAKAQVIAKGEAAYARRADTTAARMADGATIPDFYKRLNASLRGLPPEAMGDSLRANLAPEGGFVLPYVRLMEGATPPRLRREDSLTGLEQLLAQVASARAQARLPTERPQAAAALAINRKRPAETEAVLDEEADESEDEDARVAASRTGHLSIRKQARREAHGGLIEGDEDAVYSADAFAHRDDEDAGTFDEGEEKAKPDSP